jgi:hypothetical protein
MPGKIVLLAALMLLLIQAVQSVSVNEGEESIQRRLGEHIAEEDRSRFESLLARSGELRKEIASLSRLLPAERASERIKQINVDLQQTLRETVDISRHSSGTARGSAAERAIERARKRDAIRRLAADKQRREQEDFHYVQNMRKMELVEHAVAELQARAAVHRLDAFGMCVRMYVCMCLCVHVCVCVWQCSVLAFSRFLIILIHTYIQGW